MRRAVVLALFLLFLSKTWCQVLQNGGFENLQDFINNNPTYEDSFIVNKRTIADIKAWGGSDYKIESQDPSITKKIIKKKIWGIVKNDTLYLNGIPITGLAGYVKVEILGKYSFMHPAFPINSKIQDELGVDSSQFGYMFGAIGGAIQGAQIAVKRISLIYNMETGEKMLLTKQSIFKMLQNHLDLREEFMQEPDHENEEMLLKYLIMINKAEE